MPSKPRSSGAGIDGAEVDDVIMGCATPEGATGSNIARQIALRAGLPITTSGMTVNRFCSSGLQTIAMAAQRIIAGENDIVVAGGVESISCVQNEANKHMLAESWLLENKPTIYWNMLQTAEQVAKRYSIPRQRMDEYGAASQQRATAAREAGKFEAEIAPITVLAGVADAVMGLRTKEVTVSADEGIRAGHHLRRHQGHQAGVPGGVISAGNASQFSDGAGAVVVMNEKLAEQRGLKPLGRFLGFAVAGCEPDEMGIGPVFAVPEGAEAPRPHGRRHRPLGAQRGRRRPGAVLRRHARHPDGPAQRRRRRDRRRPSVRRQRPAPHRPCPDRRQAARRQARRRHDVHRRRHGRGRRLRGPLSGRRPARVA
jgi:acetyl-CoA acetyltransferase family protein